MDFYLQLTIDVEFYNEVHCSFDIYFPEERWNHLKEQCWAEIWCLAKVKHKRGVGAFKNAINSTIKSINIADVKIKRD